MFVLEMHRAYDFYVTSNVSDGVVPIFFNATVSQENCSNQGMGAVCHQREFDLPEVRYKRAAKPFCMGGISILLAQKERSRPHSTEEELKYL